jgi:hypothetical protein
MAANAEGAMLGEAHDRWLHGIGVDIDKLRGGRQWRAADV